MHDIVLADTMCVVKPTICRVSAPVQKKNVKTTSHTKKTLRRLVGHYRQQMINYLLSVNVVFDVTHCTAVYMLLQPLPPVWVRGVEYTHSLHTRAVSSE